MNRIPVLPTLPALALLAAPALAQSWELEELPARWRLTVERVEPDGYADPFALVGLQYELLEPFADWPGVFAGVGAYGSADDDLGGFFAGGLDLGWRRSLPRGLGFEAGTGLLWRATDALELGVDVGRVNAVDQGSFDASVFGFSAALDVTRLISRR